MPDWGNRAAWRESSPCGGGTLRLASMARELRGSGLRVRDTS